MVNAARGREMATRPTRYVFDEGHHLFDAADAMFSTALTGQEAIEIRRWVVGPEAKARGYDPKTMRTVVRLRKMEKHVREESEALLDTYKAALGLA